jgi:hypothetical protein
MSKHYYTYRITIADRKNVQVEKRDPDNKLLGQPSGKFGYKGRFEKRIQEFSQAAYAGALAGPNVQDLGEMLFDALFDEVLQRDFFDLYEKAYREHALLRLELDINERELPDVAALPWEFMHVPSDAGYGLVWLGTDPNVVLSRRCARWAAPEPIQLKAGERLRIALAVADPGNSELGPVKYEEIWEALNKLANLQPDQIELLELVNPATTSTIDDVLEKEPHIFHFIGHAQLKKDENEEVQGQVALVDGILDELIWVSAERFGELFNRHRPGVVVLQACESAAPSASKALVGIASYVVEQNIPVVVAMQYEISNSTARRFAFEFYHRLSKCEPVDKAAQEGRRRIALEPIGYTMRDFATPVLFVSVRDAHLFQRSTVDQRTIAQTLPGLALRYRLNRVEQIAKLKNILDDGNGGGIMIWGRPRAGHKQFKDIAIAMMHMRGIRVLDPIDVGDLDYAPVKDFFVSALEDRLNISREAEIVSTDGKKKKEPNVEDRLERIIATLQRLLGQQSTALIFFALHKTGEDVLRWLWDKVWITYLEPLAAERLWMLFFSDDTKGTGWWRLSPVEPEFIYLADMSFGDVFQFLEEHLPMSQSEARIWAQAIFGTEIPPITPEYLYSAVQATIVNWKAGAQL